MYFDINKEERTISVYLDNTFINEKELFCDFYDINNYECLSSDYISIECKDNLELERTVFELKEVEEKIEEYLEEYFDDETYWD